MNTFSSFTNILGQYYAGPSGGLGGEGLEHCTPGTIPAAVSIDSLNAGHLWSSGRPIVEMTQILVAKLSNAFECANIFKCEIDIALRLKEIKLKAGI